MAAALVCSGLVLFCLFFSFSEAREILVGGKSNSWKIPASQSESLNKWAESNRFVVGDSLVWEYYAQKKDSVLQVSETDYSTCNVSNPIKEMKNGNTKFELERSGAFYFISGVKGHCEQGEKLVVLVISSKKSRFFNGASPSPSPMEFGGVAAAPAPSPTSGSYSLRSGLWSSLLMAVIAFFYYF